MVHISGLSLSLAETLGASFNFSEPVSSSAKQGLMSDLVSGMVVGVKCKAAHFST